MRTHVCILLGGTALEGRSIAFDSFQYHKAASWLFTTEYAAFYARPIVEDLSNAYLTFILQVSWVTGKLLDMNAYPVFTLQVNWIIVSCWIVISVGHLLYIFILFNFQLLFLYLSDRTV
ncbi:hypothetical protein GQR58_009855 [Nymphon striatum]|nr:hypothetical protein GQR58_009855 [Nymphon striatum]